MSELHAHVPQYHVRIKPLPHPFKWEQTWAEGELALLTNDGTPVTLQLAQVLIQQGLRVVVLNFPGIESIKLENVTVFSLDDSSDNAIGNIVHQVQQLGEVQLFIHLHPVGQQRDDLAKSIFWLAKHLQANFHKKPQSRCSFLVVTRLNGSFGYGSVTDFDWQAGGLSGLIKSLNREWPHVFCRTVDLHPSLAPEQVVDCLLTELQDIDFALAEVGYDAALKRLTLAVEDTGFTPKAVTPPVNLAPSDVVVVTGGARGITAECVIALANSSPCTFILMGRTSYHAEEPSWAHGIKDEKELKQKIFRSLQQSGKMPRPVEIQEVYQKLTSSRSIKKTIQAIHEAGGKAVYLQADIGDAGATQKQLSDQQEKWGMVTAVIHGAGALADKLIEKKTEGDFAKVYGTKVHGLLNVINAVDATRLKNVVLFSSIVGFYGNEGQIDYALANDTLNKWAISYQNQHPETKVTAINWGPWNSGMITPYVQQEFKKRGVMLIQAEEGVAHFMNLLSQEKGGGVTIVNNKMPAPKKLFPLNGQILHLKKGVKREENPFLEHHVIGGFPVMPFVTGIAWISNASEQLFPSYQLVQCQNSKLFNGIIFNGKQSSAYFLDLQVVQQDEEAIRLTGKVWSNDEQGRRRYHYGSDVLLLSAPPVLPPTRELPAFGETPLKTRETLYQEGSLFHGPTYQGIEALWQMDEKELWYTCALAEPDAKMQGQFPLQRSKTFATDAMCQGFLVWAFHHLDASCLPSSMGSMIIYEPLPFDESFWVHLEVTEQQGHKVVGNATAINSTGKVLVAAEGITLTVSKELLAMFPKTTDSLAVVGMDIHLPGIKNLDQFHRTVYDGIFPDALSLEASEATASFATMYQKMRKEAGGDKPLAMVHIGDLREILVDEMGPEEIMVVSTFPEAMASAQSWLHQNQDSSIVICAQHAGGEAMVRLMVSSEAQKAEQPPYAVLSNGQPFTSSSLDALMAELNYLDVDPTIKPDNMALTPDGHQEIPRCALGTLIVPHAGLQDLARLIKVSLCLHYRFIPALRKHQNMTQLAAWDAQLFYAPENSFTWIPENSDEKRIAAIVFKDDTQEVLLKLQEAEPAASKSMAYIRQQDRKLLLVSGNDTTELQAGLERLEKEADSFSHQWAEQLYQQHLAKAGKYTISLIAGNKKQLLREISFARRGLEAAFATCKTWQTPMGSYFSPEPLGKSAKIGFVYPGLASAYVGMIKDNIQLFPQHFDYYSSKLDQLHELVHQPLVHPRFLEQPEPEVRKKREAQFLNNTVAAAESSISLSVYATQVLRKEFKLEPEAALGYSMGGITMFFAMEVWGFQHLRDRVRQSPVFQLDASFKNWTHWVLNVPAEQVEPQLAESENLYLTFINSPGNVILSGDRAEGEAWMKRHHYEGMMVDLYNVAHCPPIGFMHEKLEQMHLLDIEKEPKVRFYSGVTQEVLPLDKVLLAKNAADTYCQPVDFVSQIQKAYQDGVNVFIEVGPKSWCSRLVGEILTDQRHVAMSINQKGVSDYQSLLQMSSVLCSHGVPINLPFYEVPIAKPAVAVPASSGGIEPVIDKEVLEQLNYVATAGGTVPKQHEGIYRLKESARVLQEVNRSCYLYQGIDTNHYLSFSNSHNSVYKVVGHLPALPVEKLGNASFLEAHHVKYPYMAGAMANGIASEEMVIALGQEGFLGSFGAAGLSPDRVEQAIVRIQEALPEGPYAFNLIHSPADDGLEMRLIEMYLRYKVRTLEASAFMELSLPLVYYRAVGLVKDANGKIRAQNKVIAKISRSEVARPFLLPAPDTMLEALVLQGKITPEQMQWAKAIPMADDITVEADSGGHTDQQPLVCSLPEIIRLKARLQKEHNYARPTRIGAAGGISTPAAVVAAFALGADYVVTGSVNQSCMESGTSLKVKELLAKATSVDVVLAPSADMFEMGVSVQVLKRGTLYANRAKKLYQLYTQYDSLSDIPADEMAKLEKQLLQRPVSEIWSDVETFFQKNDPHKLEAARQHPKKKMALIFRWYLGLSSKWAVKGVAERAMDYQIWCGPAMGAFNDWVKGSPMEAIENRKVAEVAKRLLQEAALQQRVQLLKAFGVSASVALPTYSENEILDHHA
ncbi:PfaD family polyunsaturated fatty acid/polyketide biosynthesis protein [Pontibacter silvestris]|uniref:PfaD family polyunsaturated fatty acid/polyketide biosynthesis protein n=1 Tax=Pontibacter silvestris TaxID=2305183 RepID=A0ABW4X5L7_9BACT|nr:PfaD family polyunsaturated fatty acid/polyketide biosynthesis protein [Pontibacter silvestris]MCC9138355.1 PfaD family polyunsaturated fatty acid/polyketide biosynthesis protein [Pontibacter silvestris]